MMAEDWDTPAEGDTQVNGAQAPAEGGVTEVSDEASFPHKPFYAMAKRWQEGEQDKDLEEEVCVSLLLALLPLCSLFCAT